MLVLHIQLRDAGNIIEDVVNAGGKVDYRLFISSIVEAQWKTGDYDLL